MFELNKTSAYEPAPAFNCNHNWMTVGPAIKTWTSTNTGNDAPEDAPVRQKRQCLICGGFEWNVLET